MMRQPAAIRWPSFWSIASPAHDSVRALISPGSTASGAWPSANRAILVPFRIAESFVAVRALYRIVTASGNADAGIYNWEGRRLASTGSIALTTGVKTPAFTATVELPPGSYWMALAVDNTTAAIGRETPVAVSLDLMGVRQVDSAFPLPDSVTPDTPTAAYLPYVGTLAY
jgi:hypothetical protein